MATIASLIVKVSLNAAKLKRSLSSATKRIKAFTKSAIKILKKISIGLTVGPIAAVTAITVMVNKYAARIDRLAKTSSKLGMTVSALQKLQYQAELTGISSDTMNMALQRMVRRVSEAAAGTGEAKNALVELGISAEYLNKLSPDKQFYAISEAMRLIGSRGDQVRLSMKIFDTEGVGLVNTMNGNLKQMGAEFDSLGISITQSVSRMVESYNDAKSKMWAIFSGFGLQLTAQLAAPFKIMIDWITTAVKKMGGMDVAANKFAKAFISGIGSIISAGGAVFKYFKGLKIQFKEIETAWLNLKIIKEKLFGSTKEVYELSYQVKVNDADLRKLRNEYVNFSDTFDKELRNKIQKLMSSIGAGSGSDSVDKATIAYNNSANSVSKLADAANKARNAISPSAKKKSNVIDFGDMSSRIKAQQRSLNLNDSTSGLIGRDSPGFIGSGGFTGKVGSIQDYINASPAGKALQDIRKGQFLINSGNTSLFING